MLFYLHMFSRKRLANERNQNSVEADSEGIDKGETETLEENILPDCRRQVTNNAAPNVDDTLIGKLNSTQDAFASLA
jgi:hypothetical protein